MNNGSTPFLYLCNIHHVGHESKAFKLQLRDVCLEQHVDLKREHKVQEVLFTANVKQCFSLQRHGVCFLEIKHIIFLRFINTITGCLYLRTGFLNAFLHRDRNSFQ